MTTRWKAYYQREKRIRRLLLAHMKEKDAKFLIGNGACLEACLWVFETGNRTLVQCYSYTRRIDWLRWVVTQLEIPVPDVGTHYGNNVLAFHASIPPAVVKAAFAKWGRKKRK
jgi:hypothetical protein